jgi:uncharacterized protein (TIGR00661 family)
MGMIKEGVKPNSTPLLKCLFVVQGEGRGHLTQALALRTILAEHGHDIVHVMVGQSSQRKIPAFFYQKIRSPVSHFDSPNYIWDSEHKGLDFPRTIYLNLNKSVEFLTALRRIHRTVTTIQPDVIVNFFEPLVGIYALIYRPAVSIISVAHQYLFLHPQFRFPPGRPVARFLAKILTRISAIGSKTLLALSLYPLPDIPGKRLHIVPPLIRREVLLRRRTKSDGYLLFYILNSGYCEEIIAWHEKNSDIEKHCFWDKRDAAEEWSYDSRLTFHRIDDVKFLDMMCNCRAVITTAGFESICEACFLKKNVTAVPVGNHFDQLINAYDLRVNAGLGSSEETFRDIDPLKEDFSSACDSFRLWVEDNEVKFLYQITGVI